MENKSILEIYEQCVRFHGHRCPGLAVGVRAAVEAARLLSLSFSQDEDTVCITENDACGVDGIQCVLGCSAGKGNLIFRIRGKQAFNVYDRRTGKNVRLILKAYAKEKAAAAYPELPKREAGARYILEAPMEEVFSQGPAVFPMPEEARHFASYDCELCGESTAEPYIRLQEGKRVCPACYRPYHRLR